MNISQSALDSAVAATAGAVGSATAQTVIEAALPYLVADLRERLVKAAAEKDAAKAEELASGDDVFLCRRLAGEAAGIRLALSYLDEMTR